jgi:predicted ester cyclase
MLVAVVTVGATHEGLLGKGVDPMSSAEENKALARHVIEEMFHNGNLEVADEHIAPDYVSHDPAMPENIRGPEGFKEYVGVYRTAFPDLHIEIEDQIADGDKVATRWTGAGTHEGEACGHRPHRQPCNAAGAGDRA